MSDYSMDINQTGKTQATDKSWMLPSKKADEEKKDNSTLTFDDMLLLMVTQMQNQTIDNQMDTSDMMNQLIQMTVMQALTDMTTQVEDLTNANIMSYSASLVGKEVTVGVLNNKGELADEVVGTVTATGTYNGQQVIFMGDKYYPLSSIMSVGKLPEKAVDGTGNTEPEDPDGEGDKTEGGDQVGDKDSGGETTPPAEDQTPEAASFGLRDNTETAAAADQNRSTVPSGAYTPRPSAQSEAAQNSGAAASQNRNTVPSGVYTPHASSGSAAVQGSGAASQAQSDSGSDLPPWLFENGSPAAQAEESGVPSWLLTQSEQAVISGVPSWLVGPDT